MTLKTELIEAMARAIARHEYDGGHLSGAQIEACVEEDMRTSRGVALRRLARAALDAQHSICTPHGIKLTAREPTEEMKEAFFKFALPVDAFHAMHDAAPDLLGET